MDSKDIAKLIRYSNLLTRQNREMGICCIAQKMPAKKKKWRNADSLPFRLLIQLMPASNSPLPFVAL